MGKFKKPKKPRGQDLRRLEDFVRLHEGVEAYFEPETATMQQSLLMVARGGEWDRTTIAERDHAARFCSKLGIPFYDAAIVGYPERMRGVKGKPAPAAPSAEELEAWFAAGPDESK